MDLKLIKNILDLISKSEVNEVSIEEGDFKIKVKKGADLKELPQMVFQAPTTPAPQATAPSPSPAPVTPEPKETPKKAEDNSNYITIKSPMVGTFYKAPSPNDPAFASVGDSISKGDTLCIIEAMKIMNEIASEESGKIVKVLVDDAQPVEFDQPLFLVDPS